ncbi:hypothetical protein BKA83DRAFT_4534712 [Pisolithus microcarpus]|nr:hypothetical protein BKA83DRAFT_4534712 [Pisolithus microcarpus]
MYIPSLSNIVQALPRAMLASWAAKRHSHPWLWFMFSDGGNGMAGTTPLDPMHFGQLAHSVVPSSSKDVQNHEQTDLASLLEYTGRKGPQFRAIFSRTTLQEMDHVAALLVKQCTDLLGTQIHSRETEPVSVTIVNLTYVPHHEEFPMLYGHCAPFYTSIPILVSMGTLILFSIIVNDVSCLVIGSGTLCFIHLTPVPGSPPGDGILGCDEGVVLLKGQEGDVNAVMKGRFSLLLECKDAWQSITLIRAITQLILVPQSSPFGQLMFVISVAVSWLYKLFWWSINKEKVKTDLLMKVLGRPCLAKFILITPVSMVIFIPLALDMDDPKDIINSFPPPNTWAWQIWKAAVIKRLWNRKKLMFDASDCNEPSLLEGEQQVLETLFKDAQHAYEGFEQYRERILLCSKMQ